MTAKTRQLDWDAVSISGMIESQRLPSGIRLARLPNAICRQIDDPMLSITAAMAAGMRFSLQSDTSVLEVEAFLTGLHYIGGERRPIAFDLFIEDQLYARHIAAGGGVYIVNFGSFPPSIERRDSPAERVIFKNLPAGMKQITVWLPHNAEVELTAVRVDKHARVMSCDKGFPKWVHYGSSVSHGKEVEGPAGIWPALVAQHLKLDLTALGFSGQCMLDGAVARVIAQSKAALISLKLGANIVGSDTMRGRTFRSAVHNVLDIIREQHRETPILVMSPIIAPALETNPGPAVRQPGIFASIPRPQALLDDALTLQRTRVILEQCIALRRSLGDLALHYLDGRQLLGKPDVSLLVDGLHPDAQGHQLIAKRLTPVVQELLAQSGDPLTEI